MNLQKKDSQFGINLNSKYLPIVDVIDTKENIQRIIERSTKPKYLLSNPPTKDAYKVKRKLYY